jgi:hypothetical protein
MKKRASNSLAGFLSPLNDDGVGRPRYRKRGRRRQVFSLPYKREKNPGTIARAALKKLTTADCHEQPQSPLFGVLSPELRNMIVSLVLRPEWHEPSEADLIVVLQKKKAHTGASVYITIDTALLRTCRLIYVEAKFLPVHNNIHHLYPSRHLAFGGLRDTG